MLQDIHVHLQDIKNTAIIKNILTQAGSNGLGRMACNATNPSDWDEVMDIRAHNENVIPFFGVHPWMVKKAGAGWEGRLKKLLLGTNAGVGEIGLDHGKFRPDRDLQLSVFKAQLDMALELKRPVAIHCVGAWGALLEELKVLAMKDAPFMIHLFSGSVDVLQEIVKIGGYLSFSLGIAEGGPEKVRLAFEAAPLDRLLLETDYPYVPGKREGEPLSAEEYFYRIRELYAKAASIKGMDAGKFERLVWDNGSVFMRGIASR